MTQASSYQVQLDVFQGPLDLLLHLIEQQELDITTISLAQVTNQYLAYLGVIEERCPDDLADFLVLAARLLLIKSRALLPRPPKVVDEEEDVGEDLVRQLREYKRFKQIGEILRQRDRDGLHTYLRTIPASRLLYLTPKLDLGEMSLNDLVEALGALLREEEAADDDARVVPYKVTINQKIERIGNLLRERGTVTLDDLLERGDSRIEVIVTLLAVLEMVRTHRAWARQDRLFGPISITALDKEEAGAVDGSVPSETSA